VLIGFPFYELISGVYRLPLSTNWQRLGESCGELGAAFGPSVVHRDTGHVVAVMIPHLPFADILGLSQMPAHFYPILALIIFAHALTAELAKRVFYSSARTNLVEL
jgi:hypothetical protein